MSTNSLRLWSWDDAPEEYKALSPHSGGETHVALVPTIGDYADDLPGRLVPIDWVTTYKEIWGVSDISEHPVEPDGKVLIGANPPT